MNHLVCCKPYFKILSESKNKRKTLDSFPSHVINAIIEIIVNGARGNLKISSKHLGVLKKQKTTILRLLSNINRKRFRRKILSSQRGGFISAVAPILASVLSGLLARKL